MRRTFAIALMLTPAAALAQPGLPPSRIPPNVIDRTLANDSSRIAADAARRDADRARADQAARTAAASRGPVVGSTMTDGLAGTGAQSAPASPPPVAPQP